jgi:prephenate dehydrogenase
MLQAKQVTIIGTGLLGASLALALKLRGFDGRIVGVGRRESTLAKARGLGCFDGLTTDTGEALADGLALGDGLPHMAVLAAPLGHFQEIFVKVASADDAGLIITDVGSTKATVCEMAKGLLPDASRFVGSHPMAGSEQQGPTAADGGLFEGKPCVVTPGAGANKDAVELVEALWSSVGMKLTRMPPEEHDKSVALVSHLPHAVASLLVLMSMGAGEADGKVSGVASTGFADTTRIASGDPGLWVDIFRENRGAVIESLDAFGESLKMFRGMIERGDDPGLMGLLEEAKRARDDWGAGR